MTKVSTLFKRFRGAMRESDGKALQDPVRRAEGRRLQEEARVEAARRRAHGGGGRGPRSEA
ncbi:hypothetical protein ACWENA_05770 [Streptomyces sp. NPDC004779]